MKIKLKRYLARFLCLTILASSLIMSNVNSITAKAAPERIYIDDINSLSDIDNKINANAGYLYGQILKYQFDIKERGYIVYVRSTRNPTIYSDSNMTFQVSSTASKLIIKEEEMSVQKWYVDPGTYYLKHETNSSLLKMKGWLYFLPNSKLATIESNKTNSSTESISISSPYTFLTIVDSAAHSIKDAYDDEKWKNNTAVSNTKDKYNLTSNGKYSVRVCFSGELKDFPIVITHEVKGLTTLEAQKIKAKVSSKTYKYANVKKKAQSFNIGITGNKGELAYTVASNGKKYITVTSKGKVTVKKGTKKGTYKVTVTAAATDGYSKATKTIVIKVK